MTRCLGFLWGKSSNWYTNKLCSEIVKDAPTHSANAPSENKAPQTISHSSKLQKSGLKDWVVPEMQICHPGGPPESRLLIISHQTSAVEAPNMAGMSK